MAGNPLLGWQKRESKKEEQRGFVGENAQLQLIACGGMHSAAIEKDGSCWFWGHGEYGQNASAQLEDLWKPTLLSAVDPISRVKIKVLSVALGMEHCLMISTSLELFSWGRNHRGQLGLGTTTDTSEPTFVAALAKASSVAAGEDHSAGITPGGEVYTWGNAECGKLGHGSSMIRSAMSFPKQINTEVRVKKVNCGPLHTALIGNNGELLTFGAGWFGRLGHGDMNNQYSPKLVERVLPDSGSELKESPRFLEVTCGSFHTCAVCENFMLWVCGRDYLVCESDHITSPLLFNKIEEPGAQNTEIVTIAAGANHTLCVTRSGNLWGWGDNSKGQLGLGAGSPEHALPTLISCKGWRCRDGETKKSEATPMDSEAGNDAKTPTKSGKAKARIVEIPELMGVACGYAHSMAVTDNGDVWAWGLQSGGRLALKTPFDGKSLSNPSESSSVLEIGGKAANRTVKQWTIVKPVNLSRWSQWRRKKNCELRDFSDLQSSLSKTKYAKSLRFFKIGLSHTFAVQSYAPFCKVQAQAWQHIERPMLPSPPIAILLSHGLIWIALMIHMIHIYCILARNRGDLGQSSKGHMWRRHWDTTKRPKMTGLTRAHSGFPAWWSWNVSCEVIKFRACHFCHMCLFGHGWTATWIQDLYILVLYWVYWIFILRHGWSSGLQVQSILNRKQIPTVVQEHQSRQSHRLSSRGQCLDLRITHMVWCDFSDFSSWSWLKHPEACIFQKEMWTINCLGCLASRTSNNFKDQELLASRIKRLF